MISENGNYKEYDKRYRNKYSNKRHKGVNKGTLGMKFKSFTNRIMSLHENENTQKIKSKGMFQNRLQVAKGKRKRKRSKNLFAELINLKDFIWQME